MPTYSRLYPQNIVPNGTTVEQAIENDDNELKRIYTLLSSVGALQLFGTKRQSVLTGTVDTNGKANYLAATGLQVAIDGSSKPIYLAFANGFSDTGTVDLLDKISSLVANAWTLPANQTCYLYVDKDSNTGLLSYGYSLLPDLYQNDYPASPTLDQHCFIIPEMKLYRWNGSLWENKQRVFVASAVTTASAATLTIAGFGSRVPQDIDIFGNAGTAAELQTARNINGVSFNGTADITITQVSGKTIATTDQCTFNSFKAFVQTVTSNSAAQIVASYCPYTQAAMNLTLSLASTGANGLDTGTVAANTWYYTYVIYGTAGVACLMSQSSSSPTLPTGYIYYCRVGVVRTNASSYLYRTIQYGHRTQYIIDGTILTRLPTMASGSAGSYSTPTWVAISTGSFVPPTALVINLLVSSPGGNSVLVAPNSAYGGDGNSTNPPFADTHPYQNSQTITTSMILESINVYWAATGASCGLFCSGWEDNL
jgi:hypothetical protein